MSDIFVIVNEKVRLRGGLHENEMVFILFNDSDMHLYIL